MYACTQKPIYVSPFSRRRWSRDLRPALRTPLYEIQKAFYDEKNVKKLTQASILYADKREVVSSRILELDVRQAMDSAWAEYTGSLATEHKKQFDQSVALNQPLGGATQSVRSTPREMGILEKRTMLHMRYIVHGRVKAEKRARQLKIGLHAQAGLVRRPTKPAERSTFVGRLSMRGSDAGGVRASGLGAIGNMT